MPSPSDSSHWREHGKVREHRDNSWKEYRSKKDSRILTETSLHRVAKDSSRITIHIAVRCFFLIKKKKKRDHPRFWRSILRGQSERDNDIEERLTGGTNGWKEQLRNWNASKSWRAISASSTTRVNFSISLSLSVHSLFRPLFISLSRFHLPSCTKMSSAASATA